MITTQYQLGFEEVELFHSSIVVIRCAAFLALQLSEDRVGLLPKMFASVNQGNNQPQVVNFL